MNGKTLLFGLLMLLLFNGQAQKSNPLWKDFNNEALHDTLKLKALGDYIWQVYLFNDTDSAFYFINIMEDYARKTEKNYYVLEALNRRGIAYAVKGQSRIAVTIFEEGVSVATQMEQTRRIISMIANFHNNLGNVFAGIGDNKNAIRSYRNSLRSMEQIDNKAGVGNALHNLAVLYAQQLDYSHAMEYYRKARKNHLMAGNKLGFANGAQGLGSLFQKLNKKTNDPIYLDSAQMYLDSAVVYFVDLDQKLGLANTYNILSIIASRKNDNNKSIEYNELALNLYLEINDATGAASTFSNLSEQYLEQNQLEKALTMANQAVFYADKSDQFNAKKAAKHALMLIYKQKGNYKKALEVYEEIVQLNDSIVNREMKDEMLLSRFEYELESARLKDSLERQEERRITQQQLDFQTIEIENARVKSVGLYSALFILLVFVGFVYNRLKMSQKQQRIIEKQKGEVEFQKHIVEVKNQEIVDSINYSKRLQEAILPKTSQFDRVFRENFIFYQPKDIVSGDFYWLEETETHYFIAAADCTGHGVPGAMVSFVCSSALSKVVKEEHLTETSSILDRTRTIVTDYFGRSESSINDGMDITLVRLDKATMSSIQFSGANSSLWILRNGQLEQHKGDKQHIGHSNTARPFTHHDIDVVSEDELFLFTDGYPDQFGGEMHDALGKKIKTKNLKEMLMTHDSSLHHKHVRLVDFFEQWKGSREQTDDVLVIGLKL